jgi:type IV pilus assembly protein PilC
MQPCPHCRAENSVKRGVCFRCGEPLVEEQALAPGAAPKAARPRAAGGRTDALRGGLFWTRASAQFFRSWASLIRAGMTVSESLGHLEDHAAPAYHGAAGEMATEIAESGGSVAAAMERYPRLFLRWQVALVRSGEAAGALEEVTDQIASDLEAEYQMRLDLMVKTWHFWIFTIPGMLMVLPIALTLNGPMPPGGWTPAAMARQLVFYFCTTTVPLSAAFMGAILWIRVAGRSPRWRERLERFNLRLPLLGPMVRRAALARFFHSFGMLMRAGVPVGGAMEIAADASGNAAIAARLGEAADSLRSGRTMAEALAATKVLAEEDIHLVATGEEAGAMPDILARVGDRYQAEAEGNRRLYPRLMQLIGYAIIVPIAVTLFALIAYAYVRYAIILPMQDTPGMQDMGP